MSFKNKVKIYFFVKLKIFTNETIFVCVCVFSLDQGYQTRNQEKLSKAEEPRV